MFAQKLHNLEMYNLLQVAKAIVSGKRYSELQTVCTDNELKILRAYAYACVLKPGMTIKVTWKISDESDETTTHECKVVGECLEGRHITVECEGERYDICLYEDDIGVDGNMLESEFDIKFPVESTSQVYMIDTNSRAWYFGYFTNEGTLHGKCTIEFFNGEKRDVEYNNGVLITE